MGWIIGGVLVLVGVLMLNALITTLVFCGLLQVFPMWLAALILIFSLALFFASFKVEINEKEYRLPIFPGYKGLQIVTFIVVIFAFLQASGIWEITAKKTSLFSSRSKLSASLCTVEEGVYREVKGNGWVRIMDGAVEGFLTGGKKARKTDEDLFEVNLRAENGRILIWVPISKIINKEPEVEEEVDLFPQTSTSARQRRKERPPVAKNPVVDWTPDQLMVEENQFRGYPGKYFYRLTGFPKKGSFVLLEDFIIKTEPGVVVTMVCGNEGGVKYLAPQKGPNVVFKKGSKFLFGGNGDPMVLIVSSNGKIKRFGSNFHAESI